MLSFCRIKWLPLIHDLLSCREVERLQKALDASKASELEAEVQRLEAQEALK
jgi:hypothetical protein